MTLELRTSNSSSLSGVVSCHAARSLMEAFVDGELSPEQTLEMEAHLDGCSSCRTNAEFLRLLSDSVKHTVAAAKHGRDLAVLPSAVTTPLPDVAPAFLARLEQAIELELDREVACAPDHHRRGAWVTKVTVFAAAASASLWFGVRSFNGQQLLPIADSEAREDKSDDALATSNPSSDDGEVMTLEGALDRLIDYHSSPPKPQVTSVDLLPNLEPDVGVRMQLPKLDAYGARWEGASLVPVRNQRAASFRYQLPKNRVTLYVFNASRLRVHDSAVLVRETPQPVYFGQWRGYNVAAKENRGIGYALATDMDGPAVARMIHDIH